MGRLPTESNSTFIDLFRLATVFRKGKSRPNDQEADGRYTAVSVSASLQSCSEQVLHEIWFFKVQQVSPRQSWGPVLFGYRFLYAVSFPSSLWC